MDMRSFEDTIRGMATVLVVAPAASKEGLARSIRMLGYCVTMREWSGAGTWEEGPPDLPSAVVLDVNPETPSPLLDAFLGSWKKRDVPVLLLGMTREDLAGGAHCVTLEKPCTDRELGLSLALVLARRAVDGARRSLEGVCLSLQDAVMVLDVTGVCVSVAGSDGLTLVRSLRDMEGRSISEVLPPGDAEVLLRYARECLAGQRRVGFRASLTLQGTVHCCDVLMTPLSLGVVLCVMQNRAGHAETGRNSASDPALADAAAVGLALRDCNGRFLYVNPALTRMYGASDPGSLIAQLNAAGGHCYKDPGHREGGRASSDVPPDDGTEESEIQSPDGGVLWFGIDARLVRSPDGTPRCFVETIRDITRQKQSEEELRLLADSVACARDCFMLTDTTGKILFVNEAIAEAFGYMAEDLYGRDPVMLAGKFVTAAAAREALCPEGGSRKGEMMCRRADGSEFPAEVWTSKVLKNNGTTVAFATIIRDISDRKLVEDAAQLTETRLRQITETMLDSIVQISPRGVCEYASLSTKKVLGYAPAELVGRSLLWLVHDSDRRKVVEMLRSLGRTMVPGQMEFRFRSAAGSWMWLETRINPVQTAAGVLSGFVIGGIEVTHRKRAEETLRLNEARLEMQVALTQMTGMPADRLMETALCNGIRLTRSNTGFIALLGGEGADVAQTVWADDASPHPAVVMKSAGALAPFLASVDQAVLTRQPVLANGGAPGLKIVDAVRAPETPAPRHMTVPIVEGGQVVAVVGVADRETEYEPSEARQLALLLEGTWILVQSQRARERLQQSLNEKEVLIKEVHHRVKNNLQIISSLLNLQLDQMPKGVPAEILRESQNRIRSMALIHERLYRSSDLSRVDFGHYLRNLASFLSRTYETSERRVRMNVQVQNILLGVDRAIPCGLIVNELITNALRHAFVGRTEGDVSIVMVQEESRCRISVSDNGIGLPEGLVIHKATTLGLQLVETLIEQIDAILNVKGGAGTEFTIIFEAA